MCCSNEKSFCKKSKNPDVGYSSSGYANLTIMQVKWLLPAVFSLLFILTSCEKSITSSVPDKQEVAGNIYKTETFIQFSRNFMIDMKALADYYRTGNVFNKKNTWLAAVKSANDQEENLEKVYSSYGLSFSEAINRKNKVDNDFLLLFHQHPILLKFNETDVWEIIKEGISLGWASQEPGWLELKNLSAGTGTNLVRTNALGSLSARENKIDVSELWSCLKEAVGFGAASVLGIGGLQKLASEGIQAAVINVSKWLAKRAGWIGAAVMALDFANCVYTEAQD